MSAEIKIKAKYAFVEPLRLLIEGAWNYSKLINAIQAELGSANWQGEKIELGSISLKKNTGKYTTSENAKLSYEGETTNPIRLASWGQAMEKLFKQHGEPSGELTVDVVPVGMKKWLDDKFAKVAPAQAEQAPSVAQRGNGDVKNVPALQPAGAKA